MGRLGFLTEVRPGELVDRLSDVLEGSCRIEERTMLQAQVPSWGATHHALNDVVVGRDAQLEPLHAHLAAVRRGAVRVVFVEGGASIASRL